MVAGNIWVVNNDNIPNCRPLKLKRDNAYPLVEAKATPVNVTTKVTIKEFHTHFRNDVSVKSVLYDPKLDSDVNNDNELNILDIVTIVNIILSDEMSDPCSDFNQDGTTNILDLVSLVSAILEN